MSANIVAILLFVCMACKLDGAALLPTDQPQQWQEFVASVEQKLTTMERQLAAKDVRIDELETKLENHIAVFTKYKNDAENGLQAKNSAINQLKQQLTSLLQKVSEIDMATRDLGKRVSDLEQPIVEDLANGEESRRNSTKLSNVKIGEASAGFESKQNNITYDDRLRNDDSISTEVPSDEITHQDRTLATSQIRAVQYTFSPVAFHAELSKSVPVTSGTIVAYDHEMIDEGAGYNPSDGIYVVPQAGTYVITWTSCSNYNDYTQTNLIVNGVALGSSFTDSDQIHDLHQSTALVILRLSQGDHLFIRVRHNQHGIMFSSFNLSARPTFSGWKLF